MISTKSISIFASIFLFAGLLFFALPQKSIAQTACCINQTGCIVVGGDPVLCFEGTFVPEGMCTQVGEGGQCVAAPTDVPTLSEWGLIAMAGVLGVVGFMVIKRKRAAA